MKTTGSLIVFLVLVNGLFAAPKLESIIKGQGLAGWVVPTGNDQAGWYTIEQGVLKIKSGPKKKASILWTGKKYRNFVMEFEFLFGEGRIDTGIHIRNNREQIQIGISGSLKRDMTGSPYIVGKGYPVEAEGVAELLKQDDWNAMKIEVVGKKYTVWLQGKQVMTYVSESAIEEGPIGIQLHGGRTMSVDFRSVKLAELP